MNGEGRRAVVLVGDRGSSSPGAQGLSLSQLVPQLRDTLFFLRGQRGTVTTKPSLRTSLLFYARLIL